MLKNIINKVPILNIVEQEEPAAVVLAHNTPLEIELEMPKEAKEVMKMTQGLSRFPFRKLPGTVNMIIGVLFAGTVFIGACIYFDRMRHRDPDFPRKLKEQRKRTASKLPRHVRRVTSGSNLQKASSSFQGKRLTVTIPSRKYEDILINEICIAETYMKQQNTEQALIHFATAIAMSYDPSKIINSLKRTLPPLMYNDLAFILNERYENKFSFMYDDRQMLSRIHVPVPQHSMLYQ